MKNKRQQKNQGYSLVELIVVIAIVAVVSSVAAYGIGMASGWEMKQCTRQLDDAIGETKMNAMSKGACVLEITRDTSGNYYMQMKAGNEPHVQEMQKQRIADRKVKIYYVGDDADTEYLITETNPIQLSFDSGSGAYKPIPESVPAVYYKKIIVRMGTDRTKTIRLVKDTGRHYVE